MSYTNGLDKPSDYFNTLLYTGNGSNRNITGVGFQPDWTWIKCRSASDNHILTDAVRGANKQIFTNSTGAELSGTTSLTAFGSDGFSLGTDSGSNGNGRTFASWNWKAGGSASSNSNGSITSSVSANQDAGFSIVKWSGNGSASTIGHGLGSAPSCIITKSLGGTTSWGFYHQSIGNTKILFFNETGTGGTHIAYWNNTSPTSSVFTVGSDSAVNHSGNDMIAYCFAEKKGYSKFGSYVGNGSTNGSYIHLGFTPAWVLIKKTNTTENWLILDTKRGAYNFVDEFLQPNNSNAEQNHNIAGGIDVLSNGIKMRHGDGTINASGGSYIFMAFAENPFTTSTGIPATAK